MYLSQHCAGVVACLHNGTMEVGISPRVYNHWTTYHWTGQGCIPILAQYV